MIQSKLPLGALRITYKALLMIAVMMIHIKNLLTTREANFHSSRSVSSFSASMNFFVNIQSLLFSVDLPSGSRLFSSAEVGSWEGRDISGIQFTTTRSEAIALDADFNFLSTCFLFSFILFHSCCIRSNLDPHSHSNTLSQLGNG